MKIVCDSCSTKYSIADEKVRGKVFKIKCKKCNHIIVVKGDAEGQPNPFEQKETKVFDYAGAEGNAAAAGAAGEPVWHLVVDREQIGPLTVEDVRQRWAAGEIDGDTYAWREGFGDWLRVSSIDELAGLAPTSQRDAAPDDRRDETPPPQDVYTPPPPSRTGPTVRTDPADLFAAAAAAAGGDEDSGHDLFGAPRIAAPSEDSGGIFSSSAGAAAEVYPNPRKKVIPPQQDPFEHHEDVDMNGAGGHDGDRPMTGQRNDNSVLFSLNNLASMATEGTPPPRKQSTSSFPSTGGQEGSGLIDIRAMAAMTLGSKRDDRGARATASEDDLPVFSSSSFSAPAHGVLLPNVTAEKSNKTVYILIGAVGLLAAAAIALVVVIMLGKKETPVAAAPLAANDTHVVSAPGGATPPAPSSPPPSANPSAPAAAVAPASAPTAAAPASGNPSQPAAAENPPAAQPEPPAHTKLDAKAEARQKKLDAKKAAAATAAAERRNDREREPAAPPPPVERHTASPPSEMPKPTGPQKCDEVACLVTPDLPCCPGHKGGSAPAAKNSPPAPSAGGGGDLPDKLDQPSIIDGMKSVNGKVNACNDQYHVAGAFKVSITVGPDGSVSAASASPPIGGTPAAACVERAVHAAHFKKTKSPITFKYPYTFH